MSEALRAPAALVIQSTGLTPKPIPGHSGPMTTTQTQPSSRSALARLAAAEDNLQAAIAATLHVEANSPRDSLPAARAAQLDAYLAYERAEQRAMRAGLL
jgi:hypothetical protein